MSDPEQFKYDVRVRERMLDSNQISQHEVEAYLGALPDLGGKCDEMELVQPALAQPEPVRAPEPDPISPPAQPFASSAYGGGFGVSPSSAASVPRAEEFSPQASTAEPLPSYSPSPAAAEPAAAEVAVPPAPEPAGPVEVAAPPAVVESAPEPTESGAPSGEPEGAGS